MKRVLFMHPNCGWRARTRVGARRVAALVLAIALAGVPAAAEAKSAREIGDIAFDVVVLRPLNAAAVVLGGVFFVASAPLVWPGEGIEGAWETFVYYPYEYTFLREVGDIY